MRSTVNSGREWVWYALLATVMAVWSVPVWAGDVTYSVAGIATEITDAKKATFYDAEQMIDLAVTADVGTNVAEVTVTVGADQTSNMTLPGYANYAWNFDSGKGYKSVTLDGGGYALKGNAVTAPLLQIKDVTDSINISNFSNITGGVNNDWGAGLTIDNNTNNATHGNTKIAITNVTISNNQAEYTGSGQGGGLAIRAAANGLSPNNVTTILRDVDLLNNKVVDNSPTPADQNNWGGGAWIARTTLDYLGGTVSGNSVISDSGTNAYGGGVATTVAKTVNYVDVAVIDNTATVNKAGTANPTTAFGGGLLDISSGKGIFTVGGTTYFEGNQAIGTGDNLSHANGGGVALLGQKKATFDGSASEGGAMFRNNIASSALGNAAGGGLALVPFKQTGMVNPDDLTLTSVDFSANKATAELTAQGGGLWTAAEVDMADPLQVDPIDYKVSMTGGSFEENIAESTGGTARGGAVSLQNTGENTFSGVLFRGNSVKAATTGAGGALYASGTALLGITDSTFSNNTVEAATAQGGGIYRSDGDLTVTGSTVSKNSVTGTTAAQGGGIYLAAGNGAEITNTSITGNRAVIGNTTGTAEGGGIYFGGNGDLTLKNSSITGNDLQTGDKATPNGHGSAIYIDTAAGVSNLNLTADAGKETEISGNTINNSGIADRGEGIYIIGNSNATIAVSGAGTTILDDGMTVIGAANFELHKQDAGTLEINGRNTYDAASTTLTFSEGAVRLGETFTAVATQMNRDFTVEFGNASSIVFDADRAEDLAMFDFSENGNNAINDKFIIGDATHKVNISADIGRLLDSEEKEYTIATGLTDTQLQEAADNLNYVSNNPFVSGGNIRVEDGDIIVDYAFRSPFDVVTGGPNANNARDGIRDLDVSSITDDEWLSIANNARAAYPELALDQARIMVDAVDLMSRSAVDYGLRAPHRLRMRTELGYAPGIAPGQTVIAGEDYSSDPLLLESEEALPSAVLNEWCGVDGGLRLWAGYVGDWATVDPAGGLNGYTVDRNGVLIGLNYDFGAAASVGVYGGYAKANSEADLVTSTVEAEAGQIGVQARVSPLPNYREFSVYLDAGYSWASNDFSRNLGAYNAGGSFNQKLFTGGIGLERVFILDNVNLTPHAEARVTHIAQDAMTETGNSITTTRLGEVSENHVNTRVGLEVSRDFHTTSGVFSPSVNAAWRHDFGDRQYIGTASYVNSQLPIPTQFNLASSQRDRDSLDIGVAMKSLHMLNATSNLSVNIGYNYNLSRNAATHSLYTGLELGF